MSDTFIHADHKADRGTEGAKTHMEVHRNVGHEDAGHAAESFEHDTRDQLNLLREKTFNRDLRQLVDRVRDNEPGAVIKENEAVDFGSLSEEELQLRLARLYYLASNIRDNREINISFNPFELKDGHAADSIRDSVARYAVRQMNALSLPHFALLSYTIAHKGYVPTVQTLARYDATNVVIGLRDALFERISHSKDGFILDVDAIREDPFLGKIFSSKDGEEGRPLYFVLLSAISSSVTGELLRVAGQQVEPFLPSAILMMELPALDHPYNIAELSSRLKQRMSLPYFILNDNHSLVYTSGGYSELDYSYHMLDYLFAIFLVKTNYAGISIKSKSGEHSSMMFLIKYMISKLNKKLSSDSVIVHIIKNRLIILTKNEFLDSITGIFNEYNKLFNNQFTLIHFRPADFDDSLDMIKRIILSEG